jgi:hypothetical protein
MTQTVLAKSKKLGNQVALVDDEDYEKLAKHKWFLVKNHNAFYAIRKSLTSDGRRSSIAMHQEVLDMPSKAIDHKDRNGLNNQKHNLRLVTTKQNTINAKMYKNNKSGYKGVSWCRLNKRWRAQLSCKLIGWYDSKEEAARAYDKAAKEKFGEYATLNFQSSY